MRIRYKKIGFRKSKKERVENHREDLYREIEFNRVIRRGRTGFMKIYLPSVGIWENENWNKIVIRTTENETSLKKYCSSRSNKKKKKSYILSRHLSRKLRTRRFRRLDILYQNTSEGTYVYYAFSTSNTKCIPAYILGGRV